MIFKQNTILLLVAVLSFVAGKPESNLHLQESLAHNSALTVATGKLDSDSNLQELLAHSYANKCFDDYSKCSKDVYDEYEVVTRGCNQTYEQVKYKIEADALKKRKSLESSSDSCCNALFSCNELQISADILKCYAEEGAQNEKAMYSLNIKASKDLNNLNEESRLAEHNAHECYNDATKNMEEEINECVDKLEICVNTGK